MLALGITLGLVAATAAQPRIGTTDGNMQVSLTSGKSFSISCPNDGAIPPVACSGPNVEVVDGSCVPITQFATTEDLAAASQQIEQVQSLAMAARQVAELTNVTSSSAVASLAAQITAANAQIDCIPFVERPAEGGCVPLSPVCRDGEFEAVAPTRTSDRVCRAPTRCSEGEFEAAPFDSHHDRRCERVTSCNSSSYQLAAPTATSDRVCRLSGPRCPPDFVGITPILTNAGVRTAYCHADGTDVGGAGNSERNAGKSCNTIRRAFNRIVSGTYWIYGNNRAAPFQVYCDMTSCGGDASGEWINQNQSLCGGWTMVMKHRSGDSCLNRDQSNLWRRSGVLGETTSTRAACGKGPAYTRNSFTDVMIGSIRDGRSEMNFAWRHPTSRESMYAVIGSCERWNNGELIVPGYGTPSRQQRTRAIFNLDWRRGKYGITASNYQNHFLCNSNTGKFGFLGRDSTCCGRSIVGCRAPGGHAGNVVGWSDACGNGQNYDCNRNYNSQTTIFTYCVSAFGFGSGYGGMGSSIDRESTNGHWWGHGSNYMQVYDTGLYVRDSTEWPE